MSRVQNRPVLELEVASVLPSVLVFPLASVMKY
jgi:hypothetical protein